MTKKEQKELRKLVSNWTAAKQSAQVIINRETPGSPEHASLSTEVETYQACIEALDKAIRGFHLT